MKSFKEILIKSIDLRIRNVDKITSQASAIVILLTVLANL